MDANSGELWSELDIVDLRPRDMRYIVSAFAMRVSLLSIDVIWSCRTFI
jgi:hypothetical protein